MRRIPWPRIAALLSGILVFSLLAAQNFDAGFLRRTLRMDYIHSGSSGKSEISLYRLIEEPFWGGPVKNLIDTFNYGECMVKMFDLNTNALLYSRGFSTLFNEWLTTPQARTEVFAFEESILLPFPREKVKVVLYQRDKEQEFQPLFSTVIDPGSPAIIRDQLPAYSSGTITGEGLAENTLDIVILPEGYTSAEKEKFIRDATRFADNLLSWAPYRDLRKKIRIRYVFAPSDESGTDVPGDSIWKRTLFDTHFYTFGTERYLSVKNIWKMHDVAAVVPYDAVCVLVNTTKYGGGGIFNFYTVCTADNNASYFVFCHEFGHAFAGLADEYFDSEVAYEGFYNLKKEPWEPNITTLVQFEKKWKNMLEAGTPVPTPPSDQYKNKVGVFEGGGYMAKGIYRPWINCSMRGVVYDGFCPVCQRAITCMVNFISDN